MKIGILGGGQLGKMLIQAGLDYNLHPQVLDPDPDAPCKDIAKRFVVGKLSDYQTVFDFGQGLDLLTVEIEAVNVAALMALEKQGVRVYPQPQVIALIQNKRSQKMFYQAEGIPTSPFVLVENRNSLQAHTDFLPAFQKLAGGGYDGRGVVKLADVTDFEKAFDAPGLLERLVEIDKEISVIVARNQSGELSVFPPVELVYHEENLVDYLISPALISPEKEKEAVEIAKNIIKSLDMVGLLSVELFLDKHGKIWVNEVAPRPHNSGHQSIEANYTSQYAQFWRSLLNLPLGNTGQRSPAGMINLLGDPAHKGIARYEGLQEALKIGDVYVHLYGKRITKPYRKMGHATVLGKDRAEVKQKIEQLKKCLHVYATPD